MNASNVVNVQILDKTYPLTCPPQERAGLESAARYVDGRMRELRNHNNGSTLGTERLAILVALTVTHELLRQRAETEPVSEGNTRARVQELLAKVEQALNESVKDAQMG